MTTAVAITLPAARRGELLWPCHVFFFASEGCLCGMRAGPDNKTNGQTRCICTVRCRWLGVILCQAPPPPLPLYYASGWCSALLLLAGRAAPAAAAGNKRKRPIFPTNTFLLLSSLARSLAPSPPPQHRVVGENRTEQGGESNSWTEVIGWLF